MENDAEMMERLKRMVERSHPSEWTREAFPGDVAAIRRALALIERYREALEELVEVADLRGDSTLPHPADDPLLWTARMQTAWDDARAALAPDPPAETEATK